MDDSKPDLPGPGQLAVIMMALFLGMFTSNLDTTILATAIPKITAEFHSINDIGWYGSSAILTFAAFQTTWGKVYKYFSIKWSYLLSLFIFELGSLVCALAPNSTALIAGRAIAGMGGAGLTTGTITIIGYTVKPELQSAFMGVLGATYTLASFVGPISGGAFAENVTWRWCFWLNLPIGGTAALIIALFFRLPAHAKPAEAPWTEKLLQLDPSGCGLLLCGVICYLLALQWGGLQKPWSDSSVIGTLVGFGVLTLVFVANEMWMGERASIVPRLMRRRRILVNMLVVFFNSGGFFILIYFLPLYFQVVRDDSPIMSGVHNLPFLIGGLASMASGIVLSVTNKWVPFMALAAAVSAVGGGLIYTFTPETTTDRWVGYQMLAGMSIGFVSQIPIMANTADVEMADLSAVSAMSLFFQLIGGSFSVSAAQSVFGNVMLNRLRQTAPDVPGSLVLTVGATDLRSTFTADQLPGILDAYMDGIKAAFALATAMLALSFPLALLPRWEPVRRVAPTVVTEKDGGSDETSNSASGDAGEENKIKASPAIQENV